MAIPNSMHRPRTGVVCGMRMLLGMACLLVLGLGECALAASAQQQKAFQSPEEAARAFRTAAGNDDDTELLAMFGPNARPLIFSGDRTADKQRRAQLLKAYDESSRLERHGDKVVLMLGKSEWPLPIPLVKKGDKWLFDTAAGREEVLNRRIGENELHAIQVCRAIVDAQREYAMKDRVGDGLRAYAQKFAADPGKRNGLYWESKPGEERSPLGPLIAVAKQEGYTRSASDTTPQPYHGYFYRLLTAQGKHAAGGAHSYLVKGKLVGGFGLVAYPAQYGNSGVMTFMVNQDGRVFQKNLGKNTAAAARAITQFDPDSTWTELKD